MPKGPVIAGIDIGSDKISTIIATQSSESGKTNVIGVASTPSKGLRKSQIVDIEEAIEAITASVESAERMAGYNINSAFISISGAHIAAQNSKGVVAVAEPEGEIIIEDVDRVIEAARAVSLPSSRELIHVIPRDFMVDSQPGIKDPIGMSGVRLEAEAHLVSGSTTAIRNLHKCITELGIQVDGTVFSGYASAYATLSETEKELGVALIDMGAGTTSVTVFVEGALSHSFVVPVGAKNITNDIAIGMRLSLKDAEAVKLHLSKEALIFMPPKEASASEITKLRKDFDLLDLQALGINEEASTTSKKQIIQGIIQPRLSELFNLIREELKQKDLLHQIPAGVVLTGGGASTVMADSLAKKVLSVPARIGEPKGLSGLIDELSSPQYACAVGLIHYGLKNRNFEPKRTDNQLMGNLPKVSGKNLVKKLVAMIKNLLP